MSRIMYQLIFSVLVGIFVISCLDNRGKKKVEVVGSVLPAKETVNSQPVPTTEKGHPGKVVYIKYCLVCHQADGSGVPGMYPPLGKGSWVGKDPKGLSGKVEVNGEVFKSAMPAQVQLTDQEIAYVLSYIRTDFGNSFDTIDAGLVKIIRGGK